jgi:hypothetical protein
LQEDGELPQNTIEELTIFMEEATSLLQAANIEPGQKPASDAAMASPYFSLRNDGKCIEYLSADSVGSNFNPFNLFNPYASLIDEPTEFNLTEHYKKFTRHNSQHITMAFLISLYAYCNGRVNNMAERLKIGKVSSWAFDSMPLLSIAEISKSLKNLSASDMALLKKIQLLSSILISINSMPYASSLEGLSLIYSEDDEIRQFFALVAAEYREANNSTNEESLVESANDRGSSETLFDKFIGLYSEEIITLLNKAKDNELSDEDELELEALLEQVRLNFPATSSACSTSAFYGLNRMLSLHLPDFLLNKARKLSREYLFTMFNELAEKKNAVAMLILGMSFIPSSLGLNVNSPESKEFANYINALGISNNIGKGIYYLTQALEQSQITQDQELFREIQGILGRLPQKGVGSYNYSAVTTQWRERSEQTIIAEELQTAPGILHQPPI